jgi:hypothetical protein
MSEAYDYRAVHHADELGHHVLPDGFHRIRHYGLFASASHRLPSAAVPAAPKSP